MLRQHLALHFVSPIFGHLRISTQLRYFALQAARLFCACADEQHQHVTLRLEGLEGQIPKEAFPKRLVVVQLHLAADIFSSFFGCVVVANSFNFLPEHQRIRCSLRV